jgi:glycosyltransferase involved in cell wall biosynthesis
MGERRYRVLFVASHAVQYASPIFRLMARHPRLDLQVAYCSLQGARAGDVDTEFGREVKWDVPLLDGYQWTEVRNYSLRPGLGRFFGLINPGLWSLIRKGRFDAVTAWTGYRYASFWFALPVAKLSGAKFIFGTDATTIQLRVGGRMKLWLKPYILSRIYRFADVAYSGSLAGKEYLQTLGVPADHIGVVPLVVDNDWWLARAAETDRVAVRASWGVPQSSVVVFCSAKLQPWKRPQDLIEAFARANVPNSYLVFAGDGPMSASLEAQAAKLGIRDGVLFLGFQNQTQMPGNYCAADLFVLTSEYDACPAVVCEAMLCGLPVVISSEIRGRLELIDPGETGYVFPCADVNALADILRTTLANPRRLSAMGASARRMMDTCSPATNIADFLRLLDTAFGEGSTDKLAAGARPPLQKKKA